MKQLSAKDCNFLITCLLIWQTNCAGGATTDFLCAKKGSRCDKREKRHCQKDMKKAMKLLEQKEPSCDK